jgi:hypothetical protein
MLPRSVKQLRIHRSLQSGVICLVCGLSGAVLDIARWRRASADQRAAIVRHIFASAGLCACSATSRQDSARRSYFSTSMSAECTSGLFRSDL